MSVMVEEATGRVLTEKEQLWADFVRDLEPWERHRLHVIGELNYHDRFIDNDISLTDVWSLTMDSCKCLLCRNREDDNKEGS